MRMQFQIQLAAIFTLLIPAALLGMGTGSNDYLDYAGEVKDNVASYAKKGWNTGKRYTKDLIVEGNKKVLEYYEPCIIHESLFPGLAPLSFKQSEQVSSEQVGAYTSDEAVLALIFSKHNQDVIKKIKHQRVLCAKKGNNLPDRSITQKYLRNAKEPVLDTAFICMMLSEFMNNQKGTIRFIPLCGSKYTNTKAVHYLENNKPKYAYNRAVDLDSTVMLALSFIENTRKTKGYFKNLVDDNSQDFVHLLSTFINRDDLVKYTPTLLLTLGARWTKALKSNSENTSNHDFTELDAKSVYKYVQKQDKHKQLKDFDFIRFSGVDMNPLKKYYTQARKLLENKDSLSRFSKLLFAKKKIVVEREAEDNNGFVVISSKENTGNLLRFIGAYNPKNNKSAMKPKEFSKKQNSALMKSVYLGDFYLSSDSDSDDWKNVIVQPTVISDDISAERTYQNFGKHCGEDIILNNGQGTSLSDMICSDSDDDNNDLRPQNNNE
jgi:hypothetical protein